MYALIKSMSTSQLLTQQLPVFAVAFVIAEMFYKFHSFMLETSAFLATWFVLDLVLHSVVKLLQPKAVTQ